jgi:uncharacterized lipoprotein YddW (UPF0748 family)
LPREFRAVWVATVANIDWPSKPGLPVEHLRKEMMTILDRCQSLHLNAVVFQVRPSADAMYASELEPWSEFLTGEQGKAPSSPYDPLEEWVKESHLRGLELHTWFNPYRARHTAAKSKNAASHISNRTPDAVKSYGGYEWMDPAESAASEQTLRVILDVVRRYDIDGVHLDDYFYPYPVTEASNGLGDGTESTKRKSTVEVPFPDEPSWQAYLASDVDTGSKLSRDNWRRRHVDRLIEKIYLGIKKEKKHVKFGISPFGIGKPSKRPLGIVGFSQYDKLYADAERWLENGWLDYFTPQLYWKIDQAPQAFGVLLDYWAKENKLKRHVWPGIYTSRINNSESSWQPSEIINQIEMTRDYGVKDDRVMGHVHFSMKCLMENRKGLNDLLLAGIYRAPAVTPAFPWLDSEPPGRPKLSIREKDGKKFLQVNLENSTDVASLAIWTKDGLEWKLKIVPWVAPSNGEWSVDVSGLNATGSKGPVVCSAIDRCGNEGERASLEWR